MPQPTTLRPHRGILLVVGTSAGLGALLWFLLPRPSALAELATLPVLGMALLVAVAERSHTRLDIGQASPRITLAALPFTLGLFLLEPTQQLVAAAIGVTVVLLLLERRSQLRYAFGLTRVWTATGTGVLVFRLAAGPNAGLMDPLTWVQALAAATVAAIVNALLISLATALANGRAGLDKPAETIVAGTVASLGGASLGLLLLAMLELEPMTLGLLAIPALALIVTSRANQRRRATNRSLSLLHTISQSLAHEDDLDRSLALLADSVRSGMEVRVAAVVLAAGSEDPPTAGIVARAPRGGRSTVVHRALTTHERKTITGARALGAASEQDRDLLDVEPELLAGLGLSPKSLVTPLRSVARPLGFIAVDGRPGDLDGLTRDDQDLLIAVATQLSTSLTALRLEQSLTELHRLQDVLRHRADHDPLTGLCNRTRFESELDAELEASQGATAVLYLDLDGFKAVNDEHGHHVGDELLRAVAGRLEAAIKTSDVVARIGGDEFAVLLRDVTEPHARDIADRLAELLAEPFELDAGPLTIETSVGIAQKTASTTVSAATLLRNADAAMYAAKRDEERRSRNFEQVMHKRTKERTALRRELERGMTFDEFLIFVQPLVDLASGRVVGGESLVRWGHPDRGMLRPVNFLDLADETGLMRELGHWVLRESCAVASEWPAGTTISVNISRSQLLADDRLVSVVATALAETGVEPSRLLLDVTEISVNSNVGRATQRLQELAALGVRIALDDFGTGFSSLEHLARMPVHALKVAMPFVAAIGGDDPAAARIGQGVIRMADALGLDTIAEGIESRTQLDELRAWGCRLGQGYLLGRPMFATDLRTFAGWDGSDTSPLVPAGVLWTEN